MIPQFGDFIYCHTVILTLETMINQEHNDSSLTYELLSPEYYLICTLNTGTL